MYHTLRNALPIVAAALGRKLGVEVGVGGHEACTDGRRIQIPDIPDDPASRDLARRIRRLVEDAADQEPENESGPTNGQEDDDADDRASGIASAKGDGGPSPNETSRRSESNGKEHGGDEARGSAKSGSHRDQDGCPGGSEARLDDGQGMDSPGACDTDAGPLALRRKLRAAPTNATPSPRC